jgi:NADH dehydrogenase [ubiquinone] 1 alpha subcomplex assembly factor 1
MSDADLGGSSNANLDYVPAAASEPSHAQFHGEISIELPRNKPDIVRTGYAGWRTLDRGRTIWGKSLWDIDPYTFLALRIKSDGRKYFVNIQTDSIIPTDLHQHRLFSKMPGQWETVVIPFNDFVRTNHGQVVEPQSEMLREKVKSVGISLIDRIPKPYSLQIARIWATNAQGDEWLTQSERGDIAAKQREASIIDEVKEKEPKKEEPEKILM